ncbi:ImmA/IrrE family metallo-endopeptidase [Clostridium sp. DL1XJH146]
MPKDEIVSLALELKSYYKTNDPFKIGRNMGMKFDFFPFRKVAMQAYVIKPYANSKPLIYINSNFDKLSQKVLCAHELGHAIMHSNPCNHFDGNSISTLHEYEANLFAVAFLFNPDIFIMDITKMDNYLLRSILDNNINY